MIINIRGTSGTGKSTLARQLMALYAPNPLRYRKEGRKQPLGYRFRNSRARETTKTGLRLEHPAQGLARRAWNQEFHRDLAVVGHYETDCGGADTIPDYDELFELVRNGSDAGMDVLFEGLLISGDVRRTTALHQWAQEHEDELHVVAIQIPLEECVESVNQRRRGAWTRRKAYATSYDVGPAPLDPANTIAKHRGLTLACQRLEAEGVIVHRPEGREAAFQVCKQLLRIP